MPSLSSASGLPASPHGGNKRPSIVKRDSSQSSSALRHGLLSPGSAGEHLHYAGSHQHHSQSNLRHTVKTSKHAKVVLPRNHSSGRNLAKLARQASHLPPAGAAAAPPPRSHEHDTEIRLPGSLEDEAPPAPAPTSRPAAMRRNHTSYQLPRDASHVKLRKNLSHGQLGRLGSNKNLAALAATAAAPGTASAGSKAPTSPGARGKSKRPRSAHELGAPAAEMDLHQQEVELAEQMRERRLQPGPRRVGFAVGSVNDGSDDDDDSPQMEGSGLQEDEWEDQSGSASPVTTRQNTANNSRRASPDLDRSMDRLALHGAANGSAPKELLHQHQREQYQQYQLHQQLQQNQQDEKSQQDQQDNQDQQDQQDQQQQDQQQQPPPSPPQTATSPTRHSLEVSPKTTSAVAISSSDSEGTDQGESPTTPTAASVAKARGEEASHTYNSEKTLVATPSSERSAVSRQGSAYFAREHNNPTTRHLLGRSAQSVAPALVSNVSALDDVHSSRNSPASSMTSSRWNVGDGTADQNPDELVSRFIPRASDPWAGSGTTTLANTPNPPSFHTPGSESLLANQHRGSVAALNRHRGPTSPGSTFSGSSGAATPAVSMSRTELRLKNEKFMADMEDAAAHNPHFPPHKFDRRNESLKSYLNLAAAQGEGGGRAGLYTNAGLSLGPEIFQGRFSAVNAELKVVQQFHNPIAGSISRLQKCKDSAPAKRLAQLKALPAKGQAGAAAHKLASSRSALALSSTSGTASPPREGEQSAARALAMSTARSGGSASLRGDRRPTSNNRVPFPQISPERVRRGVADETSRSGGGASGANAIARRLWDGVGAAS